METTSEQREHEGEPEHEPARLPLLLFRLGRELFAIDLAAVEEAIDLTPVQRVPDMPEAMIGVSDVRGSLVPVYSPAQALRAASGLVRAEEGVMLLMRLSGRRVGVAVDDVEDVVTLDPAALRRPALPGAADGVVLGITRVGRDLVAVIDVAPLLAACGAVPSGERRVDGDPTDATRSEAA